MRQDKIASSEGEEVSFFAEEGTAGKSLITQLIDALDQGVIYWSRTGDCLMQNAHARHLLEVLPTSLPLDANLDDLLGFCVARGDFSDVTKEQLAFLYSGNSAFSYEHHLPSGRKVVARTRPTRGGGDRKSVV